MTDTHDKLVRRFVLLRYRDVSGVSGTGVVAQGCVFENGWVALHWLSEETCVSLWKSVETMMHVHGHEGATTIQYESDLESRPTKQYGGYLDMAVYEQDLCPARFGNNPLSFGCTRLAGHPGHHAAGTGDSVVKEW